MIAEAMFTTDVVGTPVCIDLDDGIPHALATRMDIDVVAITESIRQAIEVTMVHSGQLGSGHFSQQPLNIKLGSKSEIGFRVRNARQGTA